ncbi:MAG: hypothetical protein JST58_00780 [Bacteroidetes bacterium]|nr:hypothetical protein [Bacteroidota bacterium]
MKKRIIIIACIAVAAIAAGLYGWHEYFRPNVDVAAVKPAYHISTNNLLNEFSKDDSDATKKYLGKIIAVDGKVKKVEKDEKGYYTIVLGTDDNSSSVRCAADTLHMQSIASLKEGSAVSVKGIFTGYNKDETGLLGSDIEVSRSVINN